MLVGGHHLAAEQGGNCELTRPGERYRTENGVTVIGDVVRGALALELLTVVVAPTGPAPRPGQPFVGQRKVVRRHVAGHR